MQAYTYEYFYRPLVFSFMIVQLEPQSHFFRLKVRPAGFSLNPSSEKKNRNPSFIFCFYPHYTPLQITVEMRRKRRGINRPSIRYQPLLLIAPMFMES